MINHSNVAGVDTRDNPHTDRPELQLGFFAMRRKEILKFAAQYKEVIGDIDENTTKENLVKIMEGFKMQGKFNVGPDKAKDVEIELLKERLAALEASATEPTPEKKTKAN